MRLLLDSDMLLFRACSAASFECELEDDIFVSWNDQAVARDIYWTAVDELAHEAGCTSADAVHCFTSRSQFRRDLFPGYKSARKTPKPMGYKSLLQEIMSECDDQAMRGVAFQFDQIEADDLIGIFADLHKEDGYVVCSGDKDLRQIPGHHLWIEQDLFHVSDDEAQRHFYSQVLTGDSTDGIPGCPTVGAKTAGAIIKDLDIADPLECWETIVHVYRTKGKMADPREYATTQARLVRVLRGGEYNFATHRVNLWNPPTP